MSSLVECRRLVTGTLSGCQTISNITRATSATNEARMSVRYGPTKFETRNCVPAKVSPQTAAAGAATRNAGRPPITNTMYAGTHSDIGAQIRPTFADNAPIGTPVTVCNMTRGVPIDPNAKGEVFASRQIAAA